MKKSLIYLILFICVVGHIVSQNLPTNNLEGVLKHENQEISMIIKFKEPNEAVIAELYIPEQFIFARKASRTIVDGDSIHLNFRDFQAQLSGRISNDTVYAQWFQRGQTLSFLMYFKQDHEAVSFTRPQEPLKPYPYFVSDHEIRNKKHKLNLSGTLTLPDTLKKHKLAILITGSGPQDRNEEIGGHKPFLVIADYLTRSGIAVFRFDDRGVGQSTGNFHEATTADFVEDVMSIVRYFRKHPHIDKKSIGLIGHSEGGIVAMMAAARKKKDVAWVISLAGPGVSSIELLLRQTEDILRAAGADEDHIELTRNINFQLYNLALSESNPDSMMSKISGFLQQINQNLTEDEIEKYGLAPENIRFMAMQLLTPWMKYFLSINPAQYIRKVRCPVLALNGSLDIQVAADDNLEAIERYLREGKNHDFKVIKLDGLNHLFQKAEMGTISEYMLISETFNEKALQLMTEFIRER